MASVGDVMRELLLRLLCKHEWIVLYEGPKGYRCMCRICKKLTWRKFYFCLLLKLWYNIIRKRGIMHEKNNASVR